MIATTLHIPTLETDRLVLRAPEARDFDTYAGFLASDRTAGIGGPRTRDQAFQEFCGLIGHWHIRGYGRWLVADRRTDEPLGSVGLMYPESWPEPEIAWSLFENAEGRGIAYEAAIRSRQFAYETLGWHRIVSCIKVDNDRSIALARRMEAVHEYTHEHPLHGPLLVFRHLSPDELDL
jgi:ribosomal-protein-alanine N-acetyltransferase